MSASPRRQPPLRAGLGLSGVLVVALDSLVDGFQERPLFGGSLQSTRNVFPRFFRLLAARLVANGQYHRRVRTSADELLDGRRIAAGHENHVEASARQDGGELFGRLDCRGTMALALQHRLD